MVKRRTRKEANLKQRKSRSKRQTQDKTERVSDWSMKAVMYSTSIVFRRYGTDSDYPDLLKCFKEFSRETSLFRALPLAAVETVANLLCAVEVEADTTLIKEGSWPVGST